ncbi:hypothetical protein FHX80_112733 [Streptomyces brevispora]|uniref:Uncharacterized protein n=1 Tax=Streptomyces brevispora TaxID=887462 RepID=A0A561UY65_9ACTN|nr:hypothetical protein FHX80_112733 [Streptomyces brevispora]
MGTRKILRDCCLKGEGVVSSLPAPEARLRFDPEWQEADGGTRRRLLMVDDGPAFELSFYCGTCPSSFRRSETARGVSHHTRSTGPQWRIRT